MKFTYGDEEYSHAPEFEMLADQHDWVVYMDGGCNPNPGGKSAGAIVVFRKGKPEHPHKVESKYFGNGGGFSNNVAEYLALHMAMSYILSHTTGSVAFVSDSNMVVQQMNRVWNANAGDYVDVYEAAKEIRDTLMTCRKVKFFHAMRAFTKLPDKLVQEAIQQCAGIIEEPSTTTSSTTKMTQHVVR